VSDEKERTSSRSLFRLIADLPALLIALLKAELNQFKTELAQKAKHAAVGVALIVVAALLAFFALAALIAAAILGLALVFPPWLAALLVTAGLLVIVGVLVLVGVRSVKKVGSLVPEKSVESIKSDANAIKGLGRYDR
jgi:amino acid transporter